MADAHIHAATVWERSGVVSYGAPSTLVRRNQVRFDCVFFRCRALHKQNFFYLLPLLLLSLSRSLCIFLDSLARCEAQNSWQARMLRKTRKYSDKLDS